jgi:hypothetical protein
MIPQELVGRSCIIQRPGSPGYRKHGRIAAYEPQLPFPWIVEWGLAQRGAFLLIELEPSAVVL